jgi:pimeloyl-ACP methyl ester carboxylesterase
MQGHGRTADTDRPMSFTTMGDDIAALLDYLKIPKADLVGHSFGGAVAALAASDRFGVSAQCVVAIGVKIRWSDDEIARAQEMARRPTRSFATRAEAIERYLKISGLAGLAEPGSETASAGVVGEPGAWRVAMDAGVFAAVGSPVPAILRSCAAPLHLAAGENDPMVRLEDIRAIDPAAMTFAGRGHNVHWEAPEVVWAFVERIIGR